MMIASVLEIRGYADRDLSPRRPIRGAYIIRVKYSVMVVILQLVIQPMVKEVTRDLVSPDIVRSLAC